jgi:hypothetical protein
MIDGPSSPNRYALSAKELGAGDEIFVVSEALEEL